MFCPNCGKELPSNAKFCSGCGTSVSSPPVQGDPQAQAPYQYQPAPQDGPVSPEQSMVPKPPKRRSRKPFLLFIPAVAVVLAVLVTLNFTAIAARFAPDYALDRGFHKLSGTMGKRSSGDNSIALLPLLAEYLQDGTITFSGEFTDPDYGDAVTFSGEWSANQDKQEFLLQDFNCSVSDQAIDPFSVYLSSAAAAINCAGMTGGDGWYGLYLDRPLSEQIPASLSLSPEEIAQMQAQFDVLSSLFNAEEDPTSEALAKELSQVFDDFLDRSKPSVSSESLKIVNSRINATVLTYRFTMQDLAVLADDFFDVLLKEEYASYLARGAYFGWNSALVGSDIPDVDAWISELEESRQEIVSTLRTEAKGEVTLSFGLASDGTLVKISCTCDVDDDYSNTASMTCALSMDPSNGDFAVTLQIMSNGSSIMEASLMSATENELNDVNQTLALDLSVPNTGESVSVVLSSVWDPTDQNFSSSFLVTSAGTDILQFTADGILNIGEDTLDLDLDTIKCSVYDSYWSDGLEELMRGRFHLTAKEGSSIQMPDFTSIFSIYEDTGLF